MRLLHLADRDEWSWARAHGSYRRSTRGADVDEVGFVHASTAAQLPGVVDRFYQDVDMADHVLLVVDVAVCESAGAPLRWEAPSGSAEVFPHIYGPIPVGAIIAALPIERDDRGALMLPDLTGLDVATGPDGR